MSTSVFAQEIDFAIDNPDFRLKPSMEKPEGIEIGDVNGDGLMDFFVRNWKTRIFLIRNNGEGSFSVPDTLLTVTDKIRDFKAADFNNDGLSDLLLVKVMRGKRDIFGCELYLNNGQGEYNKGVSIGTNIPFSEDFYIEDLDGNGFLDIMIGNNWISNGGDNTFDGFKPLFDFRVSHIEPKDINRDGDIDLLVQGEQNFVAFNGGQMDFSYTLPIDSLEQNSGKLEFMDFDNDGFDDLVGKVWYKNSKNDSFNWKGAADEAFANKHIIEDITGDGRSDLLYLSRYNFYLKKGLKGAALSAGELVVGNHTKVRAREFKLIDINADKALDIVFTSYDRVLVALNNGSGSFHQAILLSTGEMTSAAYVVDDVNGDGRDDLTILDRAICMVYFDVLEDKWSKPTFVDFGNGLSSAKYFDLDADGHKDLIYGQQNSVSWVRNLGNETFGERELLFEGEDYCYWFHISDMNNDGRNDIMVGNRIAFQTKGLGKMKFKTETVISIGGFSKFLYGDLDFDGDIDILTANETSDLQWHENTGKAKSFETHKLFVDPSGFLQWFYVDYNNDRKKEVIVVYRTGPNKGINILHSDGGELYLKKLFESDNITVAMHGDIDGDGKMDFLTTNSDGLIQVHIAGKREKYTSYTRKSGRQYKLPHLFDFNKDSVLDLGYTQSMRKEVSGLIFSPDFFKSK